MAAARNPILRLLTPLERCTSPAALKQLHAQLLLHGLHRDNFAAVKLVSLCGDPLYARAIFDTFAASANVFLWTATISSYSKHYLPTEALVLFRAMLRSGPRPNAFTVSSVLKACSSLKAIQEGRQLHGCLLSIGLGSYVYVQGALLDVYANFGWIQDARKVFDDMPLRNVVVGNTMVACYARAGDVVAAREVFDGMPERDPISWNSLISGYLQRGMAPVARGLFDEMPQRNLNTWNMMIAMCSDDGEWVDAVGMFNAMLLGSFRPDAATMAVLMSACAWLGSLAVAGQVHGFLQKTCIEVNCYVQNSLMDMYAKCGGVNEARLVFDSTLGKDTVSYNVMIGALAHHGHGRDALKLFGEMVQKGFLPDAITFLGVLSACAHTGLVDAGRRCFHSMRTTYAVEQSADHIACMVDLYGRAGLIEEAYNLVKTVSVKPHAAGAWGALLNACRNHCHVEIGTRAARELLRIEPRNAGNYVLLSNMFAIGRQWNTVEDVRRLMRGNCVDKRAGCSWIEVNSLVHEFLASDFSHPELDEVCAVLGHLYLQLIWIHSTEIKEE